MIMARGYQSVENAIALRVPVGGRLLIGVSGGMDSVVLLHALARGVKKRSLCLHVAHVDHALRAESRDDCAFVETLAAKYGVPFHSIRLGSCPKGSNFEGWARVQRYAFFHELRERHALQAIVTAHHANDVAETLLMKMLSNKQLTAIRPHRDDMSLLRPLVDVTRETIERYAARYRLSWREDSTNRDLGYLRNQVRHSLMPFLAEHFEPRIAEVLARSAKRIDCDLDALDMLARERSLAFDGYRWGERGWVKALKAILRDEPLALALRVLDELLERRLGRRFGWEHLERVREFILHRAGELELPEGLTLYMRGGSLGVVNRGAAAAVRRRTKASKVV